MGKKRTFKVGNDTYDIDEQDVKGFLRDMPNALEMKSYTVAKDTFDIPMNEEQAFIADNPNAIPTFGEVKKKDGGSQASSPLPSKNTSLDGKSGSSSSTKKTKLTDFLPAQYQDPALIAKAENIIKTSSPEDAFKKLHALKTEVDGGTATTGVKNKNVKQVISDNSIIKTKPQLDFNEQVNLNYQQSVNAAMGDPGGNGVWLDVPKDVSEKAKKEAMNKALQSEAGQRLSQLAISTQTINQEVESNIDKFSQFLEKFNTPIEVTDYLKSKKSTIKNEIENPNTNPFFLQQYTLAKKQMINSEKEKNLPEIKYDQVTVKTADGYDTKAVPNPESVAKRKEVEAYYNGLIKKTQDEIEPVAKIKSASTEIAKAIATNKMPTTFDIGKMSLLAMGDEDVTRAIELEKQGVPLTPKMKYEIDRAGEDALKSTISVYSVLAKNGDEVATDGLKIANKLIEDSNGLLNRNPEYRKQQLVNLFSDDIAKNPEQYYGSYAFPAETQLMKNTGLYVITDKMIKQAQKKFNIPDEWMKDISSSDIRTGNIIGAATSGLIGDAITSGAGWIERQRNQYERGFSPEASAELSNRWMEKEAFFKQLYNPPTADELMEPQTIINQNKGDQYLSDIPNPNAGKYNWGISSVLNAISYGAGQMYGLGKGGVLLGEGLQDLRILGTGSKYAAKAEKMLQSGYSASKSSEMGVFSEAAAKYMSKAENAGLVADKVGQFTYGYLTGYERNYQAGLEKYKGQKDATTKASLYASIFSTIENAMEMQFMPETKLVRAIDNPTNEAALNLVDNIVKKGVVSIDQKTLKEGLINVAKSVYKIGKGTLEESGEEWATNIGGLALENLTGANKDPNYDFWKEQFDTGIQTALQSIIPISLGHIRTQSPQHKNLLHHIANNPSDIINAVKKEQSSGKIDQQTANARIAAIKELVRLNNNVPLEDPQSGKQLTPEQHAAFLSDSYKIALANKEIKAAGDNVPIKERLTTIITESEANQIKILNEAGMDQMTGVQIREKPSSETNNAEVGSSSEASGKVDATTETAPTENQSLSESKPTNSSGSFENAKEGDVVTHNGVEVTVVGKRKSRGGKDVVEVKVPKKTKEEIKSDALQNVFNRVAGEYKNVKVTWADIEANHPSEVRKEVDRLTELENSRTATYTIDAEEWGNVVESAKPTSSEEEAKVENLKSSEANNKILKTRPEYKDIIDRASNVFDKIEEIKSKAGGLLDGHPEVPFPHRLLSIVDPKRKVGDMEGKEKDALNKYEGEISAFEEYLKTTPSDDELNKIKVEREAQKKLEVDRIKKLQSESQNRVLGINEIESKESEFINSIDKSNSRSIAKSMFDGATKKQIADAKWLSSQEEMHSENGEEFAKVLKSMEKVNFNIPLLLNNLKEKSTNLFTSGKIESLIDKFKKERLKSESKSNFSFEPKTNEILGTPEIEITSEGKKIGQLRTYTSEENPDVLITNGIEVNPKFQKQGAAKEAYIQLAKSNPDKTIQSSGQLTSGAKGVWESLVKDGIAEKVGENKYEINSKEKVDKSAELVKEKESNIEKLKAEMGMKIRGLKKDQLSIDLPPLKKVAYSDNPIGNKEKLDSIKKRLSILDDIIKCL